MTSFNTAVSKSLRTEKAKQGPLFVGQKVMAVTGKGMFADCWPARSFVIAKINKVNFKTECGLSLPKINIR